jgi:anaerobic selenocysteine-containing dehydrogenase
MFGNPIAWGVNSLPDPQWADGVSFGRFRSRVRGAPGGARAVSAVVLAEEIATPGDGQIQALVTIAGNPVISAPDSRRLDAALPQLECMISVDNALNETTRHAHVILPGHSALEQAHFDDLIAMWAVRSAGNFSPAIFPPPIAAGVGDPRHARRPLRRDAARRDRPERHGRRLLLRALHGEGRSTRRS